VRPAQSDLMMLVVGWWESDMPAKHTQKIRAMDSGVLLTAYGGMVGIGHAREAYAKNPSDG